MIFTTPVIIIVWYLFGYEATGEVALYGSVVFLAIKVFWTGVEIEDAFYKRRWQRELLKPKVSA